MKKGNIILIVIGIIVFILFMSLIGIYNSLNQKYQDVGGAKSQYSSALNNCTEKIKGVWEITNQYLEHESTTQKAVTEARNNYAMAAKAYEEARKSGDTKAMTTAGNNVVNSALAFQVQIEAYPNLKGIEATKENMRNMEEAINQIKTALDDWIMTIRLYNTYRGNFWPSLIAPIISNRFPSEIEYYEGEVKTLDVNNLNPEKKQ